MDRIQKQRRIVRSSFTRLCNQILSEIESEEYEKQLEVKAKFKTLKIKKEELQKLDSELLELLLEAEDTTEEEIDIESKSIDEYCNNYYKVETIFYDQFKEHNYENLSINMEQSNRKFKLPKIELIKYDGSIKGWLSFWSMFKKIDEDPTLDLGDKFQYLIQCTVDKSRARELVLSYPATAENYPKVIESFKTRFGKNDVLVEFYIRELLSLVILNSKSEKSPSLSSLYDQIESQLRALESLGITTKMYDAILFPLVESCIPEELLRVWQRQSKVGETPKDRLDGLMLFMRNEVDNEQKISMAVDGFDFKKSKLTNDKKSLKTFSEITPTANDLFSGNYKKNKVTRCIFCQKIHESKDCFSAGKMSFEDKIEKIKQQKACFSCLKVGHRSKVCKTFVQCFNCGLKHWILMCPELKGNRKSKEVKQSDDDVQENTSLSSSSCSGEVILQTILVKLKSSSKERTVRAIIDSGSQQSYILKTTANCMGYVPKGSNDLTHILFGGSTVKNESHLCYSVTVANLSNNYSCTIPVLDQNVICGKLPRLQKGSWMKELKNLNIWITDYGEGQPEIELLIGADICGQLFTGKKHELKCGLTAMETKLGWIIMGRVQNEKRNNLTSVIINSLLSQTCSISKLWDLDILGISDPTETKSRKELEMAALDYFQKTISINQKGRYEVRLPWLEQKHSLQENKSIAEKRCISTSTKLKTEGRYEEYEAVFKEWEDSEIIELVPPSEIDNVCHYLPHRGVFKEHSTTRLRPVFDASSHEKGYPSLNDCLEKGPNLLEEIPPLLVRFRMDHIGVVSDIKKAFLQISIAKEDRNFLRFFWWEDFENKKVKIFRHNRVVFGLTCSPFLLSAVINTILTARSTEMKETVDILKKSFYVDNCITSVSTQNKLNKFIKESTKLFHEACFDLRGWEYSRDNVGKTTHVLGMLWNKQEDSLFCDLNSVKHLNSNLTRRNVLSTVHKVFDPLGILCPVTLQPKVIVQKTWTLKIGWDTELPENFRKEFENWCVDLPLLSSVKISRCLGICDSKTELSLHVFCDASKLAYSTVIFLRKVQGDEVSLHFIQAKSRIAPLHKMTIPRLELLACCIGVRLASTVIKAMDLKDIPTTYWTDSSTVLYWIYKKENWSVFVSNRVKEIRSMTKTESWRHIPGELNPADLPSRGCSAKIFLKSNWLEGPSWLKLCEEEWPVNELNIEEEAILKEKRKCTLSSLVCNELEVQWYNRRFSKYSQILRMVAWIYRFINNCKKIKIQTEKDLSVCELESAEKKLIKIVQNEALKEDDLKALYAFIDDDGLRRLKTKISRRDDDDDFLCPIVLPSKHELVDKLILERHLNSLHAGVQVVLANIRQQFWIIRGRKTIQRVISKCVRCRRHDSKGVQSVPTPLPENRIRDSLVFEISGVDLAGPLHLKDGKKAWILLFTCAVYRAIHLELIQSLSTNCFMLGFRRFIARRGRPKIIYSDNGSNFVGADNLFSTIDWDKVISDSSIFRIQWKFNPPTAAWWGGWWERLVQMVKKLLRRILGKACLMYEEMSTILCDVEAVVNNRPLTYISEDSQDLLPLSPSMFIQDIRIVGVPDLDQLDKVNISKRWRYQQNLRDVFRRRFREEYLSLLVQKPTKHKHLIRDLKPGDIVLIGYDNKKRIDWPLGRIISTFPGKDENVRVVRVKTAHGEVDRPVQKIYPLEISHCDPLVMKKTFTETQNTPPNIPEKTKTDFTDVHTSRDNKPVMKTRSGRKVVKPKRYEL